MSERSSYKPGTPSYVDIGVPDIPKAVEFYGALFGWDHVDFGEEAGNYGMFQLRGLDVAGIGPQQMPDAPPFWSVYVSVADVKETADKVRAAGGTVVVEPMDVFENGSMAVFQDPNGTFISVWQPKDTIGAQLVNEPGTFGWNELATTNADVSRKFYTEVFGWGVMEPEGHPAGTFTLDGDVICGSHTAGEGEFPAWSVWFGVEDCDAAAAKVTELGGAVYMPPNDMDFGRGAVVAAPDGAVFGIAAPKPETLEGK